MVSLSPGSRLNNQLFLFRFYVYFNYFFVKVRFIVVRYGGVPLSGQSFSNVFSDC